MWALVYIRCRADRPRYFYCQQVASLGFGLTAEAARLCVELLREWAVVWQGGLGLIEQGEAVVPGTCRLLDVVEAFGEAGGGFGGLAADLGDVAGGFAGFADGVEVVVVFWVESAESRCQRGLCGVDEASAAEVEIGGGRKDGFDLVEGTVDVALVLANVVAGAFLLCSLVQR